MLARVLVAVDTYADWKSLVVVAKGGKFDIYGVPIALGAAKYVVGLVYSDPVLHGVQVLDYFIANFLQRSRRHDLNCWYYLRIFAPHLPHHLFFLQLCLQLLFFDFCHVVWVDSCTFDQYVGVVKAAAQVLFGINFG